MHLKMINLSDARALARQQAQEMLGMQESEILDSEYVEGEGCWIFFRRRTLTFPPHMSLASSAAYAVSKWGEVRIVADFSGELEEANALLLRLSEFFLLNKAP